MTEPRTNQSAESEEHIVPPLGAGASAAALAQPAHQAQAAQSDKGSATPATGKSEAEGAPDEGRTRRGRFAVMRSLQFRLMVIFVVVGMILTAIMSVMSYNRMVRSGHHERYVL